jgi:hypothetical protein
VDYHSVNELARLCSLRASVAKTPAAADALRRMAKEYEARAAALKGEDPPGMAEGVLGAPVPEAPSSTVQQQQQPQLGLASADRQSSPSRLKRP